MASEGLVPIAEAVENRLEHGDPADDLVAQVVDIYDHDREAVEDYIATVAACHNRNNATEYRDPKPHERQGRQPCRFCFPDEEIDVPESALLVSARRHTESAIHRSLATGPFDPHLAAGPRVRPRERPL